MRKIETKEDLERKERRNKIIIGVILVGIMILSTAGYAFFNNEKVTTDVKAVKYNGRDFYMQGNFWLSDFGGNTLYFTYLPNETSSVSVSKTISDYSGKTLYYTDDDLATQEVLRDLNSILIRPAQQACFEDSNCTGDYPIKNCSSNIITTKQKYSGTSPVIQEENCIYLSPNDSVRSADAFLYRILGVK